MPERGGAHALGLEVEQLAGLVAELDGDGQGESDEREREREERSRTEHEQRAARQRIESELLLDRAARGDAHGSGRVLERAAT